jgi:hypothetical protein
MLLVVAPLRKAGFALLVQKILQGCNNPTEGAFLGTVANSDVSRTMDSADPSSGLSNLRETETDRHQPILLAYRPGAHKAETLPQPQHGFEPPNRPPRRVEGLKAADPRHGPLDPEVVALDPLLPVPADIMERILRQEPVFPGCRDGRLEALSITRSVRRHGPREVSA